MILEHLNHPVSSLKGIGQKNSRILERLSIRSVGNLLEYFPRAFSDRTKTVSLKEALTPVPSTVKLLVTDHRLIGKKYNKFLKVLVYDGANYGALVCFNRNYLAGILKIGGWFYITGRFNSNYGEIQCSNFEIEEATDDYTPRILPVYPLTEGLTQNIFRHAIEDALKKFRLDIENELPEKYVEKRKLLVKREALRNVHFPESFSMYYQAKKTFIYEEFFFQRLFLLKRKESVSKIKKMRKKINSGYKEPFVKALPFELTDYQKKAVEEIEKDIFSEYVFSRLLQGDVGSGKTIVAVISMLSVVESGFQCALMAPTEVLSYQHYNTIKKMFASIDIRIGLLTGDIQKKERDVILGGLKSGGIDIIIGTHSLFSEDVVFGRLGFVVIDEQHRFGVEQRLALLSKGNAVDLLLMTATPIPRSLALSLYGDLELTTMRGVIKGRMPVKTWFIDNNEGRISKMHEWIKTQISGNGRAIFVYPLIEDSDKTGFKSLEGEYKKLKEIYSQSGTGFIHSRLSTVEKNAIMESFKSGEIKILTATTVVEVGIDVPEANVIVIENADNYGLSTLHQLRGRVGRNNRQGYMVLIAEESGLTEDGKKRIDIMMRENDGFRIAEEDLLMRGPGDFLGSRQSGLPDFKFADIRSDLEILKEAGEDAEELFRSDGDLERLENLNTKNGFLHRLKTYMNNYTGGDA